MTLKRTIPSSKVPAFSRAVKSVKMADLKVGDRVRTFCGSSVMNGEVIDIAPYTQTLRVKYPSGGIEIVHEKQLIFQQSDAL